MNFWAKAGLILIELISTKVLIPLLTNWLKKVKDEKENGKEKERAVKASENLKKAISEKANKHYGNDYSCKDKPIL